MQLEAYLIFNGDCAEAFRFYEKTLRGKIEFMQTFGDSPAAEQAPPGWNEKIVHVLLRVGDAVIMASDSPPDKYKEPQGLYVSIGLNDDAEAERIYKALSENAKSIDMPLQETFWATKFAMLTDRFGTPWMINSSKPNPS
jgi:PhnB protein